MGAIESSYFTQVTDCISDFDDPNMAALLVFLQYFTQLEVCCKSISKCIFFLYILNISCCRDQCGEKFVGSVMRIRIALILDPMKP